VVAILAATTAWNFMPRAACVLLSTIVCLFATRYSSAQVLSAADSSRIHKKAVQAVDVYELAGYHYWAGTGELKGCALGGGGGMLRSDCQTAMCRAASGAPCITGRELPCQAFEGRGAKRPGFPCVDVAKRRPPNTIREIAEAYDSLISSLRAAADKLPEDRWVLGQLTFYLVRGQKFEDARRALDRCTRTSEWCAGLRLYVDAKEENGLLRVERGLQALPALECASLDYSLLTASTARHVSSSEKCSGEELFERRAYWWLSDPSWLISGNDRLAEQFIRSIEAAIQDDWGGTVCRACGSDARARVADNVAASLRTLLRAGPSDSWAALGAAGFRAYRRSKFGRVQTGFTSVSCRQMLGFNTVDGFSFVPPAEVGRHPDQLREDTWGRWATRRSPIPTLSAVDLCDETSPTLGFEMKPVNLALLEEPERFLPRYASKVVALNASQVAFFRRGLRGDSASIVATWLPSTDSVAVAASRTGGRSGLIAFTLPRSDRPWSLQPAIHEWQGSMSACCVGRVTQAWDTLVVGLENLLGEKDTIPTLARTRFTAVPPSPTDATLSMSDLLFYNGRDIDRSFTSIDSDPRVLATALTSTVTSRDSVVGIYWEMYGLQPGDSVTVKLRFALVNRDESIARSILRSVRGARDEPVYASWEETIPVTSSPTNGVGQTISLRLSALTPGGYDLGIEAIPHGRASIHASRRLIVR
jgi:hypothetical protein